MNESLAQDNERMKQQLGYQIFTSEETHGQSELMNQNGKRPLDASPYQ